MNKRLREWMGTAFFFLMVLGFVYLINTFVCIRTRVEGISMEATLSDGENLITDKISYRFRNPERFEIIIFPFQGDKDNIFIKRIIGLPGETVQIGEDGIIYINGEILKEGYGKEVILANKRGLAAEPVTLSEDEYFVMGDNRNQSFDSREQAVGNIRRKDIIGRVWVRIWPLDKIGFMQDR